MRLPREWMVKVSFKRHLWLVNFAMDCWVGDAENQIDLPCTYTTWFIRP